jgi:hypothetical protein
MTQMLTRHKLIGGVLGVVSAAWAVDVLTGEPGPSPANAALSPPIATELVARPPDPADLASVIESLRDDDVPRARLPLDAAMRDLFVPTPQMEAALEVASPATTAPEPPATSATEPIQFETRHELQGVLTGRVPLAVIDGRLYPRGSEVDGYRLVELRRDCAIFQRGESQVTLRVATAGRSQ